MYFTEMSGLFQTRKWRKKTMEARRTRSRLDETLTFFVFNTVENMKEFCEVTGLSYFHMQDLKFAKSRWYATDLLAVLLWEHFPAGREYDQTVYKQDTRLQGIEDFIETAENWRWGYERWNVDERAQSRCKGIYPRYDKFILGKSKEG